MYKEKLILENLFKLKFRVGCRIYYILSSLNINGYMLGLIIKVLIIIIFNSNILLYEYYYWCKYSLLYILLIKIWIVCFYLNNK